MANKSKSFNQQDINLLLKTIDEKNEELNRITTRFKDVTHAYKSLLAEKKALEITIKAMKSKPAAASSNLQAMQSSGLSNSSRSVSDISESENAISSSDHEAKQIKSTENCSSDGEKIAALTANIQLILDNKSKMELSYQAEKKKLRSDIEDIKTKFDNYKQDAEKMSENYETKIKELRVSLKQSQLEREKLNQDLNSMIKMKSNEQDNKIMSMHEENQAILLNLRNENNELKTKIKNLNKQFDNKCEQVIQCENEIKSLKKTNESQISSYETQLNDMRTQLKELTSSNERRIIDLEANISQLCLTIGNYENNNMLMQNSYMNNNNHAARLLNDAKYKVSHNKNANEESQIDLENKAEKQSPLDIEAAIEQISSLKQFVESKAKDLNIDFNFNELWSQNSNFNMQQEKEKRKELQAQIDQLKEENRHLREEYEKYKIRTNYLIKSAKSTKDSTSNQDHDHQVKKLKEEIDSLKKRMILLEREKQEDIKKLKEANENYVNQVCIEYKQQLEKLEQNRLKSLNELEKELVKQRERTFKLLAEKDSELEKLKNNFNSHQTILNNKNDTNGDKQTLSSSNSREEINIVTGEDSSSSLDQISLNKIISNGMSPSTYASFNGADASERLIYYSQQNAYKDGELNKLRLAKMELEYRLKQTIDENSVDADRYQSQIDLLKQEIERLKLNYSRNELNGNGANLEYIKNVIFNYMTTKDPNIKQNLTNSLVQILHFTKSERQKLQSTSSLGKAS